MDKALDISPHILDEKTTGTSVMRASSKLRALVHAFFSFVNKREDILIILISYTFIQDNDDENNTTKTTTAAGRSFERLALTLDGGAVDLVFEG